MAGPFVVGRHTVVIAVPSQRVFDYLADMTRHREWNKEGEDFDRSVRPEGRGRPARAAETIERQSSFPSFGRNWSRELIITASPEGPIGIGSVFRREWTAPMQGPLILRGGMGDSMVTVDKATTITAYEPYSALVFETRNSYNGLLQSIDKVSFELREEWGHNRSAETDYMAIQEATNVSMVSEVEVMVPGVFIGPVYALRLLRASLDRLFPKMAGPHLPRIKQIVEGEQADDRA